MSRRSRNKTKTPTVKVAKGDTVDFPRKERRSGQSAGLDGGVRRPGMTREPRPRTMPAYMAAEACALFGRAGRGGGAAFEAWLGGQVDPKERRSLADWTDLLEAFANRPIYGHRRTNAGGNHRINRAHRR